MSKELHESPETIWLQIDPDGVGPAEWDTIDDATWCKDQINDSDVKYARYDKLERLDRELGILRKQHREAHDGQAKMWSALTDISCLTHLGGEVMEYGVVTDAVKRLKEERDALQADNARLVEALDRIVNGPWPSDMEGPEDQCRFDRDIATAVLAKVRKP